MREKEICSFWEKRMNGSERPRAFVVMAFNRRNDLIYDTQIKPMLANLNEQLVPVRADTVMRTGYIVCQKICRQIVTSDIVVVDVTNLNNNVLYEMGLSVALPRNVLLMAQAPESGQERLPHDVAELLRRWGVGHERCLVYKPFEIIYLSAQEIREHFWNLVPERERADLSVRNKVGILGADHCIPRQTQPGPSQEYQHFQLTDALRAQMGNSLRDAICRIKGWDSEEALEDYLESSARDGVRKKCMEARKRFLGKFNNYHKGNFKEIEDEDKINIPLYSWMMVRSMRTDQSTFAEIAQFIDDCEYLMIDITPSSDKLSDAINLFWIGYCQVYDSEEDVEKAKRTFDIQGLYYFGYDIKQPQRVCDDFNDLFYKVLIQRDLNEEIRNTFWNPFFSEPELTVVVGTSPAKAVNEYHYLALAELDRYFSEAKPTLQNNIISPIYQQSDDVKHGIKPDELDHFLKETLKDRNCIVVGTPDVNIMTELVMAKAMDVTPFAPGIREAKYFSGCVTKKIPGQKRTLNLYRDGESYCEFVSTIESRPPASAPSRYCSFTFCDVADKCDAKRSDQPKPPSARKSNFHNSYGFLAFLDNPYSPGKKILILSGISGPATLALAQMLTGYKNNPSPPPFTFKLAASSSGKTTQVRVGVDVAEFLRKTLEAETVERVEVEHDSAISTLPVPKDSRLVKGTYRLDHSAISVQMLAKINGKIREVERGGIVCAIVEILIEERNVTPCWSDPQRVVSWRFADKPAPETKGKTAAEPFENPFILTPKPHSENRFLSRKRKAGPERGARQQGERERPQEL